MNIAFFLLPKDEVKYLDPESTVRQALEKMKHHRFTSVPLVDDKGKYAGTLTEGDVLWALEKNLEHADYDHVLQTRLTDIKQRVRYKPVSITAQMEEMIEVITEKISYRSSMMENTSSGSFVDAISLTTLLKK